MEIADNRGVCLAFTQQGEGQMVVLLHGTTANHAIWAPVAEHLAPTARVISLDQRGHGRSDKPDAAYTAAEFASDVIAVLDTVGAETAVIAGHSLGARNAWTAAAMYPDRVDGVICVDYTPFVEADVLDALAHRVTHGHRRFDSLDEIESYLRQRYPRLPADAVRRRAVYGYEQNESGVWHALADPKAMQALIQDLRRPYADEFASVTAPMVHIRGADSTLVSVAAWEAARNIRDADEWIVAPKSDHYVAEEAPELVAAAIESVLNTP